MSASQRTKGAVFERETADAFTAALHREDSPFKRNITQARDGGHDLLVGPLVVECKRRKTLGTVYKWLQQAIAAATGRTFTTSEYNPLAIDKSDAHREAETPCIPIVVARQDGDTAPIVILRLSDFLVLTRDELMAALEDAA
jgi:hypothetical protein